MNNRKYGSVNRWKEKRIILECDEPQRICDVFISVICRPTCMFLPLMLIAENYFALLAYVILHKRVKVSIWIE